MAGHTSARTGRFGRSGARAKTALVLLAVSLLLVSGCGKKEAQGAPEKTVNVKVWTVEKKPVRPFIETIGSLTASEEVSVPSEVDGVLRAVPVDEGTPVSRGTVLARVDSTDYRLVEDNAKAALKQAEAALANIRAEFGRKEALFREELLTRQQFDDVTLRKTVAERDLDRARVVLSLAREKLGKTSVLSPLQGMVKEKGVSAGDFARAGMPLMTIVRVDPLKLSFTIAEKDVSQLRAGQDVTFSVDPYPGREFSGRVSIVYPSLDERTRSLRAEALVSNGAFELKPGFFARVKIFTGETREAVVVPATSILYEGTRVRVFLREGNAARERSVKLGAKYGELVEVLEGLRGGENLIVVGQNNLVGGVKVHAVQ